MAELERTARIDFRPQVDQRPYVEYRPYIEAGGGSVVSTALIWARIWRRKWLIVFLSIMLFGLMSGIVAVLPAAYTSSTEMMVEQRSQGADLAAVLSRLPTDSPAVLTEAEALRSRALVQRTIKQLGLLSNPEFNTRIVPQDGSLRSLWRGAKSAAIAFIGSLLPKRESVGDPVLNEATETFLKNLRVSQIGRSQVLKATFTSESPELASEILNMLVGYYLETQAENRVAVPGKVGDFMKGELNKLQAKARESNNAVERFRDEANLQRGVSEGGREVPLHTRELSQTSSEHITVRLKRQEAEARLREIRTNPDSFPDVLASPVIQQVRKQQSLLKEERAQLITSQGPSYPRVRQIEAGIADGERRQNVEVANVVRSIASELKVLMERESELERLMANLKIKIGDAGRARVALAALEQEAEVDRTNLTSFLTQYNQLAAQRRLQVADSYVIARADIPTERSFPPVLPFLGLAFVVSVALALVFALLLERTGKTIRGSHEVRPLLTARSLGIIPKLGPKTAVPTQVIDSPQSQFTEAIRRVLSRLMTPDSLGRAVLLASAQRGEGRTSLAIALARLAAISGRRAILIDCDLRHPDVHSALGVKMGQGLTDLLQNRLELGDAIRRDTLTSLDYITGGRLAPDAANLLCLPKMAELLAKLRMEYDFVILDSPPSTTLADTIFMAQRADECLFVVKWNKTPWRLAREQMEELSHHCNVTGVVLNQVDMRKHTQYNAIYVERAHAPVLIGTSG